MTAPVTKRDREAAWTAYMGVAPMDAGEGEEPFLENGEPATYDERKIECIAQAIADARVEGREEARQYVLLACERALEKGDTERAGLLREAYLELVERMP